MLLTFGGRCNRYFWDIRLKILRSLNFNVLFQLVVTKFFKSELLSSLSKVGHVIKSCKEPITLVTSDDSDAMLTLQRIAFRADTKRYPYYEHLSDVDCPLWKSEWKLLRYRNRAEIPVLRDRSFITFSGGRGGGIFWKCTKCEGVEILRRRAGLLCKSCQTVLALFK